MLSSLRRPFRLLQSMFRGGSRPATDPSAEPGTTSPLSEQFIIFLDFLGFSHAATTWDDARIKPLLDLLISIAGSKSSFSIDGVAQEDGSYKIRVTPEITTFSDHIVASYHGMQHDPGLPAAINEMLTSIWLGMCLSEAKRVVSTIALQALNIGLLIRGGITIGRLYHASDVVFGKAMIDAYNLENCVAIYPRVAVSSRVYGMISPSNRTEHLRLDKDGIWHLDYLTPMIPAAAPPGETFPTNMSKWVASLLKMIDENIRALETCERWKELAKWAWFRAEFSELVASRFPPEAA